MKTTFPGFPPEAHRFFRDLERNNNREWFELNREIFETRVKKPMIELVDALGKAIAGFAPELNTDPKKAIFRIYRDTRFSADKTPYKTQIAAHFSPRSPQRRTFAGLYFHVSAGEVMVAGGSYMPGSEELRLIRNHIALHGDELRRILRDRRLRKYYGGLQGDQAKRPPRGFEADHPHLDLIRHKQYVLWVEKPPSLARKPELFGTILEGFLAAMPLVRFLNTPL